VLGDFDIVSYCKNNLNGASVTGSKQITAVCPVCDRWGAFYVDMKTGNYICFKCNFRGRRAIGLIAEIEQITWQEARSFLLTKIVKFRRRKTPLTLLDVIKKIGGKEQEFENKCRVECDLPKKMKKIWDGKNWRFPKYLADRKIERETAKVWNLGYCETGDFAHRLIIPISCPNGYSFTARDLTGRAQPKYKNPPGVSHSRLILGWDYVDPKADVILVEGPFDAIKMWQHGFNALSLLGKNLHKSQLRMITSHFPPSTSFVIMLDPEEIDAPFNVAKQLGCRYGGIYIAKLPFGVDPGDSTKEQAANAIGKSESFAKHRALLLNTKLVASKDKLLKS